MSLISRRQLLALVVLTLMWGFNWPMMKFSMRELTPLYFRAFTMTGGALLLFIWYRARGFRMWPQGREWRSIVLIFIPNILGWHTFSALGVNELASGRAAILGFTMPIWTVLLGAMFWGERLTRRVALAAVAVLIAIALLASSELSQLAGRPRGVIWMELAAICWALGTLLLKRAELTLPVESVTIWTLLIGTACLWPLAWVVEPAPSWQFSPAMWASVAYGAFVNFGAAQILWAGLARALPPATSAMSLMAIPIVGTMGATFIVGEWPHWQDYCAILCVTTAIGAVLLPKRSSKLSPS